MNQYIMFIIKGKFTTDMYIVCPSLHFLISQKKKRHFECDESVIFAHPQAFIYRTSRKEREGLPQDTRSSHILRCRGRVQPIHMPLNLAHSKVYVLIYS